MNNARWYAVAFAACMGLAGCKQTSDKAGASDLSKDVQSIPMNAKNNAALGGNNAPAAKTTAAPSGGQSPAAQAPQAGAAPQASGQPSTQQPAAANAENDCKAPERGCDPAAANGK
jgi:hypothetical protein